MNAEFAVVLAHPVIRKSVTVYSIAMVSVTALQLLTPVMSVVAMDLVASAQTAI
jgi:hypothetical protein